MKTLTAWVKNNRRTIIFWAVMAQTILPTAWAIHREIQTFKHEWLWEIDWVFIMRTHWPGLLGAVSARFITLEALGYVPHDIHEAISAVISLRQENKDLKQQLDAAPNATN